MQKYPPDEWIQMLLDKKIVIADSDFYSRFLSMRGSVVNLENKPEEWTSGKHGISPTNDFHTYRKRFCESEDLGIPTNASSISNRPKHNGWILWRT